MIVILGTIAVDPANARQIDAAVGPLVEGSRAEVGCNVYNICRDFTAPGVFHIVEEWEDGESHQAHLQSEHFRAFGATLREVGVTSRSLHTYDVSQKTQLA